MLNQVTAWAGGNSHTSHDLNYISEYQSCKPYACLKDVLYSFSSDNWKQLCPQLHKDLN